MKNLFFVAMMVMAGACGGDDDGSTADPSAACDQFVEVFCGKIYECTTEGERDLAGYPPTEAGCVTQQKEDFGCAEQTLENVCDGGETYDPGTADECLDQLQALECGQIRDGVDDEEEIPACGEVCTVE